MWGTDNTIQIIISLVGMNHKVFLFFIIEVNIVRQNATGGDLSSRKIRSRAENNKPKRAQLLAGKGNTL
jgi:hypothetical protein